MEIKEFIENVVSDIVDATKSMKIKYNKEIKPNGFDENPIAPSWDMSVVKFVQHSIDFDIAVTATESTESGKSGGLQIKIIKAEASKSSAVTSENSSRIKFSIPFFPEYIDNK